MGAKTKRGRVQDTQDAAHVSKRKRTTQRKLVGEPTNCSLPSDEIGDEPTEVDQVRKEYRAYAKIAAGDLTTLTELDPDRFEFFAVAFRSELACPKGRKLVFRYALMRKKALVARAMSSILCWC